MAQDLDQGPMVGSRIVPVLLGCLAVAALSLVVVPSTITFDPLTWATWAREIVHLDLNTNGGPAWKPLPVVIDAFFAPFGAAEKWVWLAVARAGGLLGVVMAYRLARRLAGRWAGAIAAAGLLLSAAFLEYLTPLGMSEPLLAGLMLLAFERHIDGRRAQAYGLLFASLLLRPETFPFFVGYSVLMWRRSPRSRPWIVALFVSLPLFWLFPDYISTGDWLRSSRRASMPTQGGPLLTGHPALAVLEGGFNALVLPIVIGAAIAMVLAVVGYVKRREERTLLDLTIVCVGWLVEEAVITQAHLSSGDQRYVIVSVAAGCVLAGVGWVRLVRLAGPALAKLSGLAGPTWSSAMSVATIAVLLAGSAPFVVQRLDELTAAIGEVPYQAHKYGELETAIQEAGGRDAIVACGPVTVDGYQMPAVAWDLRLHQSQVMTAPGSEDVPTEGTVFRTRTVRGSPVLPPRLGSAAFHIVATTPQWQVVTTCGPARAAAPVGNGAGG